MAGDHVTGEEWAAHKAKHGRPGESMADFKARAACKAREKGYTERGGDFFKPGSDQPVTPFYGAKLARKSAPKKAAPRKRAPARQTAGQRRAAEAAASARLSAMKTVGSSVGHTPLEVQQRIVQVYDSIAKRRGVWVSLADIRDRLVTIKRSDLDQALITLGRARDVHVSPIANLASLTQRERDAAVRFGGEDSHAMMIDSGYVQR